MLPKLKIAASLLKRLERVKQQCSGCLFGVFYGNGTLLLMGFNVETTIGQLNYEQIQHKFPAELDLCGLVKFGDCTDAEAHLNEIIKDVDITDNPILLHCEIGTLVGLRASVFMHGKLEHIPFEVMEAEDLYRDFCFTRLRCNLSLYAEQTPKSVRHEMHALRKMISGGSLAFHIESTKIFITNIGTHGLSNSGTEQGITNESPINNVIRAIIECIAKSDCNNENSPIQKKNGRVGDVSLSYINGALGCNFDIININVLRCNTRERSLIESGDVGNTSGPAPAVSMCLKSEECKLFIPLQMEAMTILCKSTAVSRLYDILIESVCRSLRLFEHSMLERLEETNCKELMVPRSYHFFPEDFGHFLTSCYLDGISDDDSSMQEKRKRLHRHFGLSVLRPFFRRSNRCLFRDEIGHDGPLLNTHFGIRPSGVEDGKQYMIQGNYYYYHYLQQQFQDKGWGCAYRSLQTICSWFQLQGYTEKPVPTHREIQQYLVSIGDKPASFLGSSQWIGSTEVGMCLQGLLNVESKIQHISSGGDMATIASDLAMHFQTQGTPIMIGGGVLAHTIIGIDYCAQTGQIKFLILDPHYTGADDIHIIQSKGWCGWKGIEFWDKKSYYNLCMPQRRVIY